VYCKEATAYIFELLHSPQVKGDLVHRRRLLPEAEAGHVYGRQPAFPTPQAWPSRRDTWPRVGTPATAQAICRKEATEDSLYSTEHYGDVIETAMEVHQWQLQKLTVRSKARSHLYLVNLRGIRIPPEAREVPAGLKKTREEKKEGRRRKGDRAETKTSWGRRKAGWGVRRGPKAPDRGRSEVSIVLQSLPLPSHSGGPSTETWLSRTWKAHHRHTTGPPWPLQRQEEEARVSSTPGTEG